MKLENKIEQVNGYKYLGSSVPEDMRCLKGVRKRIAIAMVAFNRKMTFL